MNELTPNHPPICVDCRHYLKPGLCDDWGSCELFRDVADGTHFRCNVVRVEGSCGIEGKFYEPAPPKKSLWKIVLEKIKGNTDARP